MHEAVAGFKLAVERSHKYAYAQANQQKHESKGPDAVLYRVDSLLLHGEGLLHQHAPAKVTHWLIACSHGLAFAVQPAIPRLSTQEPFDRLIPGKIYDGALRIDILPSRHLPVTVHQLDCPTILQPGIDKMFTDRLQRIGAHEDSNRLVMLVEYRNCDRDD